METIANRQNRQFKESILCPGIKHLFDKRLTTARRCRVIPSPSTVFQVTNGEQGLHCKPLERDLFNVLNLVSIGDLVLM